MGKCTSLLRSLRKEEQQGLIESQPSAQQLSDLKDPKDPTEIKEVKEIKETIGLINNWQSYELETIVEKVMDMCEYEKKNHMNFTLFLEFFPALKPMSMRTQMRYFELFDFTGSSYINIREIIYGVTKIYFTHKENYFNVLKEVYKRSKGNYLTLDEFKLFEKENRALIDEQYKNNKKLEPFLSGKSPMDDDKEKQLIKYFDRRGYHQYFDFYETKREIAVLESLKVAEDKDDVSSHSGRSVKGKESTEVKKAEIYKISIRHRDKVFLVNIRWFEAWVKYMFIHGCEGVIYEIDAANGSMLERRSFKFDEVHGENYKLIRPPKIYNYDMLAEYETDLKPSLRIFNDFIPLPQRLWRNLHAIYKGGPEIERTFPNLFDTIVINKVFLDQKAKFLEGKSVRCVLQPKQLIAEMFKTETKSGYIYFKRVPTAYNRQNLRPEEMQGLGRWHELGRNIEVDETLHHGFSCFVPQQLKTTFEMNYRSFGPSSNNPDFVAVQKQNRFSYGEVISFKASINEEPQSEIPNEHLTLKAYVVDMRKNEVKLHFVEMSDTCDDYYDIQQFNSDDLRELVPSKNHITTLEGLESKSVINAVLQVFVASPYFSDFFLKQKHIRSLSKGVNLQSCMSSSFSKLVYDAKKHQKQSLKPDDVLRKIETSCNISLDGLDKLEGLDRMPAETFVHKFLEGLSRELQNTQKLFDKYQLISAFEPDKKERGGKRNYIIIESFFNMIQTINHTCPSCKKDTDFNYSDSFTLELPLPEDEEVYYDIIFCPLNKAKFIRYAIVIKKSQKFIRYVQKFAETIRIELSRICFAELENDSAEFRKHFTKYDYDSSLLNLGLNETNKIYAYELRTHASIKWMDEENLKSPDITSSTFEVGSIVDFNMYTEWHVGRITGFNKDKLVIENFEGQTEVEKKRVDSFMSRTEDKGWYQIDLLHRIINKSTKIQYILTPSVISVAEWMNWGMLFTIVRSHLKDCFDLTVTMDNEKLGTDPSHKIFQEADKTPTSRAQKTEENEVSCIFSAPDILRASNCSMSTNSDKPFFQIKILLNNSGQICAICQKKTIFQKDTYHLDDKYCQGCSNLIDLNQPIGVKVNPSKISIVLDWWGNERSPLINKAEAKVEDDPTIIRVKNESKNQINSLEDCFYLWTKKDKTKDPQCPNENCGGTLILKNKYLIRWPNLLILHLNRFKTIKTEQIRLNNNIQIKRELNLASILYESQREQIYQLYGIVCHRKIKMNPEKWYCCVLKSKNVWVKVEDTHTTLIDFARIARREIYLLFYRKKNANCGLLSLIF